MLTRNRPEMAARAVRCFLRQTYKAKRLLILNTGDHLPMMDIGGADIWFRFRRENSQSSIGALRNSAVFYAVQKYEGLSQSEILIHWDDDDWSHPNRIAEQVALLQNSGADVVGYREMLFCGRRRLLLRLSSTEFDSAGEEAWLYQAQHPTFTLGTSMCYWRRTWERKPFRDILVGEDLDWWTGLKSAAVSSLNAGEPRMIASIHGGNTSSRVMPNDPEWKRVPQWDDHCRKVMQL